MLNIPGRISSAKKDLIFQADNIFPFSYRMFYVVEKKQDVEKSVKFEPKAHGYFESISGEVKIDFKI